MERVKPERRDLHPELPWRESSWAKNLNVESEILGTMYSKQDINPGVAIRKIALLFENRKFDECALLIRRLNSLTLKTIISELPVDILVDAIPHSLGILDVLFTKFYDDDGDDFPTFFLQLDQVVKQIVHWLASLEDPALRPKLPPQDLYMPHVRNIISVIVQIDSKMHKKLKKQMETLQNTLESIGQHGLVDTSDNKLMHLHDALKIEFEKMSHQYRSAVMKLEELSLVHHTTLSRSLTKAAPTDASHQRLMQLNQTHIQDRLIKNKSLFNVIEPAVTNQTLLKLLQTLEERIENDKDVLFYFSELRKDMKTIPQNAVIATIFQRYSVAYGKVIAFMEEFGLDEKDGDSDSDSPAEEGVNGFRYRTRPRNTVNSNVRETQSKSSSATSKKTTVFGAGGCLGASHQKNSHPYSPSNKGHQQQQQQQPQQHGSYSHPNFHHHHPQHQQQQQNHHQHQQVNNHMDTAHMVGAQMAAHPHGTHPSHSQSANALYAAGDGNSKEVQALRNEVLVLRKELSKSREMIQRLQERERALQDRLSEQAQKQLEQGHRFEDISLGDNRPTQLIRQYGSLYADARLDALDALDALPDLTGFDDLKGKLLFSVVVLSFRAAQQSLKEKKMKLRQLLYMPLTHDAAASTAPMIREMEVNIATYLRKTAENFDVTILVEEVCNQLWATLYDYPSLKNSDGLKIYVTECVRLAWKLSVQNPPLRIEYDCREFHSSMHTRFHTSDSDSAMIQSYLWPALMEGQTGTCLYKGVVIT
ncbi:uncharacterized protein LOC106158066 [Lingula anatina]|uniref:Mitochondria-eating protein n=1 Tax=Lingula anatina TaxID=7574 RepID=A0A1S3HWC7_LINAN|nr:uncharacterized protein LOC106158066 [Lingula anatina]|eukprot:XP_013389364.1 uncharacterized protein LOC106158066 [Lingula anatina]